MAGFIKHFDGTREQAEIIAAQSQRGTVKIVCWSDGCKQAHRIVKTLREGERLIGVWHSWHERRGEKVYAGPRWHRYYPKDGVGVVALAKSCYIVELQPERMASLGS